MIYPNEIEQKIDFTVVREYLREHCSFLPGREEVDAMTYLTDYEQVSRLLREVREMRSILEDKSLNFPQPELHDIRESLSRIRIEGLFLDEEELSQLRKGLDAVMQYIDFFCKLPADRFTELRGMVPPVFTDNEGIELQVPYRDILSHIDAILDKYGRLKDNASPELARIRKELQQSQGAVSRALGSILRQAQADGLIDKDVTPTLREGRLVIPVPPAYKRKLGGIVHDESATGKTVYVEPQQVVEANNRIRELEGDERRERVRILQEFAGYLRPYAGGIRHSQSYLARIDFLRAKARFALDINAIAPQIENMPYIDLHEARHPVLFLNFRKQHKEVVPLTLRLDSKSRILVISGPNAGGKSVCLKTVVLLQYMLQCGLPVPVREDTTMGIFHSIFIDIGDEQSIEDDLSTYSSHLRNMKQFLRYADDRSLILIDEFGGGTEPLLGGAIAEAVLGQLNENKVFGVITTHYTNLKHFAEDHQGVVNGAMLYDREALRPLFQLSIGQPGSSFAIEIARQIGLPETIIASAKELIGEDNINYDRHLQDIARDKRYWAEKRKQVHEQEKKLNELTAKYEAEMADIRGKRKEVLLKAKEDAADILERSNRTIENTIRAIKEAQADKEVTRAARQKIENLRENMAPAADKDRKAAGNEREKGLKKNALPIQVKPEESTELKVGAKVRIRGQQAVGEIIEISTKTAVVAFGNLKSNIALKKLEYVSNRQAKKAETHSALDGGNYYSQLSESVRTRKLAFRQEIDLRGYRADEALTEVMNFIDDAIMVGASEVTILHGTGSGILKQVIRDYLKMQHRIHSFHDGDPDKGGAGITIVNL
ncbi:MAG: endonuclease MutS2 [Paludibacteraceae bacterium]|nr:endonuclease MutS2 [Paludibacteraceae bacterium]